MKKIKIYLIVLIGLVLGISSCDDNTDFSNTHILTQEEEAEIRRQDSLREAQMTGIKADLVLKYEIDVKMSGTLYEGGTLEIDLDAITELFEISTEDFLRGIEGETGATDLKPFAIEGSTRDDNGTASTSNSPWGHWWTENGDVTTWGETAYVFAEFDTENGVFIIGQYPGRLEANQQITFIEAIRLDDKRVAVQITVNAVAQEEVKAQVVDTQSLTLETTPSSNYDVVPLEFDLESVKEKLGIESLAEADFIGVKDDGSYANEYTGDASIFSYWYDMEGFVGAWGDDASVYATYGNLEDNEIGIGQFPGNLSANDEINIKYGAIANNKIVMFEIKVTLTSYEDPETELEGNAQDLVQEINLTKPFSEDYATVSVDVKDILREAFRKTTYQIHQAILDGELKIYVDEISEEEPGYTADVPGYWIQENGTAGSWGEGIFWCSLGHSETELFLYGGNHAANATAPTTVSTKYIATFNGGSVTFNINFTITEEE